MCVCVRVTEGAMKLIEATAAEDNTKRTNETV